MNAHTRSCRPWVVMTGCATAPSHKALNSRAELVAPVPVHAMRLLRRCQTHMRECTVPGQQARPHVMPSHDPPANAGPRSRLQLASGGLLRWPRIPPGMLHTRPTVRDVRRAGRARAPLSMSLSAHARTSLSPEVEVQGWMVGLRRSRCARAVARAPTQMFADSEVGGRVMKCPNRGLPPRCARTGPYAWRTAARTSRARVPLFGSLSFITGASCARLRA